MSLQPSFQGGQSTRSQLHRCRRLNTSATELPFDDFFLFELTDGIISQASTVIEDWVESLIHQLQQFKAQELDDAERYASLYELFGSDSREWLRGVKKQVELCMRLENDPDYNPTQTTGEEGTRVRLACYAIQIVGCNVVPGTEQITSKPNRKREEAKPRRERPVPKSSRIWQFTMAYNLLLTVLWDLQAQPDGYFRRLLGGPTVLDWSPGEHIDGAWEATYRVDRQEQGAEQEDMPVSGTYVDDCLLS